MATKISEFQVKTHVDYRTDVGRDGKKRIYINNKVNKGAKGLMLQLEPCEVRFSASDYKGDEKFSVNINVDDPSLVEKMTEFDLANVAYIAKEKIVDKSREKLEAIATSSIKTTDKKAPPTYMKLALYRDAKTNQFDTKIFQKNAENQLVEITPHTKKNSSGVLMDVPGTPLLDILKRGAVIKPLIKASSIWVSPIGMGCSWKLEQAILITPSASVSSGGSLFLDEEEAISTSTSAPVAPAVPAAASASATPAAPAAEEAEDEVEAEAEAEDEDEDDAAVAAVEDEEAEEELPPPPPKKIEKKVVEEAPAAKKKEKVVVKRTPAAK
jgi:hypothetical protein